MKLQLGASTKLLFIGDSITDCGWKKDEEKIGQGFVRIIHDYLFANHPGTAPTVINRGISGNKMPDLQNRWKRDVLDLSPDIVSIYIGINDVWHGLEPGRAGCDVASFAAGYRDILDQTRQSLPQAKIILCEPSVLWLDQHPGANEKLHPYIALIHELAKEFQVTGIVPLHEAFESARRTRKDIAWTTDGVHPTSTGHMLIALTWLRAVGLKS